MELISNISIIEIILWILSIVFTIIAAYTSILNFIMPKYSDRLVLLTWILAGISWSLLLFKNLLEIILDNQELIFFMLIVFIFIYLILAPNRKAKGGKKK